MYIKAAECEISSITEFHTKNKLQLQEYCNFRSERKREIFNNLIMTLSGTLNVKENSM